MQTTKFLKNYATSAICFVLALSENKVQASKKKSQKIWGVVW